MTPQEEIVQLREEIKKTANLSVKRARRRATILGVLAIAVLISLVYAFVQLVAQAEQNEKLALVAENEAIIARDRAEDCARELAKCRASLK